MLTKDDFSTEVHELFEEMKSDVGDVDVDVTGIQQKAVDKLRIITTLVEQSIEKQTLQTTNAQLNTTIGVINWHTKQKKAVFSPINQQDQLIKVCNNKDHF